MQRYGLIHIAAVALTVLFLTLACLLIRKLNRKAQNAVFAVVAFVCSAGIFFRYAMAMKFDGKFLLVYPVRTDDAGVQLQFCAVAVDAHSQK